MEEHYRQPARRRHQLIDLLQILVAEMAYFALPSDQSGCSFRDPPGRAFSRRCSRPLSGRGVSTPTPCTTLHYHYPTLRCMTLHYPALPRPTPHYPTLTYTTPTHAQAPPLLAAARRNKEVDYIISSRTLIFPTGVGHTAPESLGEGRSGLELSRLPR